MSIYPTRTAAHLAICGMVILAVGIALREPVVVAYGGSFLVAIALARAVTLVSVMRIRAAGFEMLWTSPERVRRSQVGSSLELYAEVRNRDTLAARYDKLRVLASPALQTRIEPLAGEVHATGSVKLKVVIKPLRVGYHGVFGLALEVRGAPGLFEVPLTFANPFGIEVQPRGFARLLSLPHGGRSLTIAPAGRSGRKRGDGTDLRELREHLPGDPFRRIAWKASARRGQLVVKEFEREERDVVMVLVEASVELWSGPIGEAPLDRAIEVAAALAIQHLRQGDLVGLRILAARELFSLAPDCGRVQANHIVKALISRTGVLDADRSSWDESDLAVQVTEHLRPLDPRAAVDLKRGRVDKLVKRAAAMRAHAPFELLEAPYGRSTRDARLRRYAACFGLHAPAKLEPDRPRSCLVLAEAMRRLAKSKPRCTVVHVVAPPPDNAALGETRRAVRQLKSKRVAVRWSTPTIVRLRTVAGGGLKYLPQQPKADAATQAMVEEAVLSRALIHQRRGAAVLRKMGVKVMPGGRPIELLPDSAEDGEVAGSDSPAAEPDSAPRGSALGEEEDAS